MKISTQTPGFLKQGFGTSSDKFQCLSSLLIVFEYKYILQELPVTTSNKNMVPVNFADAFDVRYALDEVSNYEDFTY